MKSLPFLAFARTFRQLMPDVVGGVPVGGGLAPPSLVTDPVLAAGTPRVGIAIGRTNGVWSGAASVDRWWVLDGEQVLDANANATYTPAIGDIGKFLAVHETAISAGSIEATAETAARMVTA